MCPVMSAALFFQFVSLLASVAMVPLLLGYLGAQQYLLWMVFVTAGGLTLQLESAIQTLMVRRIAPLHAAGDSRELLHEQVRAARIYRLLSASILLLMLPLGWLYIDRLASGDTPLWGGDGWGLAWLSFALAYMINYLFGANNVLLLGTARTDSFFWTSAASRILNIALTAAVLVLGLGLLGVALSFLSSVLVNVLAILVLAHAVRRGIRASARKMQQTPTVDAATGVVRYSIFSFVAFLLYRGAFLLVVGRFAVDEAAAYGLALQAYAVIGAVALVPLQVWLHRLADAVHRGDEGMQRKEIGVALGFAVLAVVSGTLALQLLGPWLLRLIGSEVGLPSFATLSLLGGAFLVEALIMVFINPLLLVKDLGFVPLYVLVAAAGLAGAVLALVLGLPLGPAMLVPPLLGQGLLTLPFLAMRAARGLRERNRLVRGEAADAGC